jgi:hypothetical protein
MKMEDGARLRIQWSAQHGRTCPHNMLMVEEMGHKQVTGAYICTACGELFKARILNEVN